MFSNPWCYNSDFIVISWWLFMVASQTLTVEVHWAARGRRINKWKPKVSFAHVRANWKMRERERNIRRIITHTQNWRAEYQKAKKEMIIFFEFAFDVVSNKGQIRNWKSFMFSRCSYLRCSFHRAYVCDEKKRFHPFWY